MLPLGFTADVSLAHLAQSEYIFADGTFTVCPKMFGQLYTLHGECLSSDSQNVIISPLVYILMTHRHMSSYVQMLRHICTAMDSLQLSC